jgi:hypothetical protein
MASVKRARGKKSFAIGDRSGFKVPYTSLKTTWDGLRVEPEDWEPKHPQLTPPRNVVDATALFNPRPDNDPTNVEFYVGYNYDPFLDPRQRPPVGIPGTGKTGFIADIRADMTVNASSVAGIGAIGNAVASDSEDVAVTGVAGTGAVEGFGISGNGNIVLIVTGISGVGSTGNVGNETSESVVIETGLAGTGAIGAVTFFITTDAPVTGVAGTGAVGTEVLESIINETGVAGTGAIGSEVVETDISVTGLAGTGATGTETLESVINETGVAGTGNVEGFGVSGDGNIQLIVTGISGIGSTGNVGNEVSASEVIETGVAGTGTTGTITEIQVNEGWGEGAWGSGAWGE